VSVSALTQRHRAQQLLLRNGTQAQVRRIWPKLEYERLDATYPAFALAAAALVEKNRLTSAGLTLGYLREFRGEAGIPGVARLVKAGAVPAEQFTGSLIATSIAPTKKATTAGTLAEVSMSNALTQTSGALARLVLNGGRETLTASVAADPAGRGYRRVLGGGGCDFCQMLAGRGGVYTEDTADFEAHDSCGCSAEPIYG